MSEMKVCNLYAGIGGNRKLWNDVNVTAIEIDPEIASVYQDFFPDDVVIIADAHEYLLKNYKDFDFIWASPPCPTHSDIRRCRVSGGQYKAKYPDMNLYQEIILLDNFAPKECRWVVENVKPYYEPLIPPTKKLHRHFFWSNFKIYDIELNDERKHQDIIGSKELYGFDIKDKPCPNKRKVLRNMVNPELGLHILNCAKRIDIFYQESLFDEEENETHKTN